MTQTIPPAKRLLSVDIMRGLTLFLMLFVNDLYEPGVPGWLVHSKADVDGMGLADWVFPGFLCMVGMAIPYAIGSRRKKGQSAGQIASHILLRTVSLLLIGILMLNGERLNPALTGISRNYWSILMYLCVFLAWNQYPVREKKTYLYPALRIVGILGLIILAVLFRAGEPGHVSWLKTSWWGILGLIGWGYLAASLTYLWIGGRLWTIALTWMGFIGLNILSQSGHLGFPDFLNPVFGVIIDGNVPSIVMAGVTVSVFIQQGGHSRVYICKIIALMGLACLLMGFGLRHWFILSKIYGTPSWAMVCNGISMLLFALLFFLVDIRNRINGTKLFQMAGQQSLTTYLAPDILYFLCWELNIPLFFYKQDQSTLLAVGGSITWALAMTALTGLLYKFHIRLKL